MTPDAPSIREQAFTRSLRGYAPNEVDAYLDRLANAWAEREKRVTLLETQLDQHTAVVDALQQKVQALETRVRTLNEALDQARTEAEDAAHASAARTADEVATLHERAQRLRETMRAHAERAAAAREQAETHYDALARLLTTLRPEAPATDEAEPPVADEAEPPVADEAASAPIAPPSPTLWTPSGDTAPPPDTASAPAAKPAAAEDNEDNEVDPDEWMAALFPKELAAPSVPDRADDEDAAPEPSAPAPAAEADEEEDNAWLAALFPKELGTGDASTDAPPNRAAAQGPADDESEHVPRLDTSHFDAIKSDVQRMEQAQEEEEARERRAGGGGPSTEELMSIWDMLDGGGS